MAYYNHGISHHATSMPAKACMGFFGTQWNVRSARKWTMTVLPADEQSMVHDGHGRGHKPSRPMCKMSLQTT